MEKVMKIKHAKGPQIDCPKDSRMVSLFPRCANCPHWGGFLVDKIKCKHQDMSIDSFI